MIAPKGNLRSTIEDGPSYGSAGAWQGFPCYTLHFLFNNQGIIRHSGDYRDFPPGKILQYNYGFFVVAADTEQFVIGARRKNYQEEFQNERIVKINAGAANKILMATAELWNKKYSFNPDHDGFTIGNFLDDDTLL